MRLYVEVLPLELDARLTSALPAAHVEALKGRSFALPVQEGDTFEQVWSRVEERFKRNYLTPAQAAAFEIKKLQDANGFDLDLSDTVGAIFEGETNPLQRLIRVVPALIDRHFSVPITSNLRPVQAHKRARDTISDRSSSKRRRLEAAGQHLLSPSPTLEGVADRPLPSTEPSDRLPGEDDDDRRSRRSQTSASIQYVQDTQTGLGEFPPIKAESPELGLPVLRTVPESHVPPVDDDHVRETPDFIRSPLKSNSIRPVRKTYGRAFRTPNSRQHASPAVVIQSNGSKLKRPSQVAYRVHSSHPSRSSQTSMPRDTTAAPVEQWCRWCGANRSRREKAGKPLQCNGQTPCNECSKRGLSRECAPKKRRRGLPTPRAGSSVSSVSLSPPALLKRHPIPWNASASASASPPLAPASRPPQSAPASSTQEIFKKPQPVRRNTAASASPSSVRASQQTKSPSGTFGQETFKKPQPVHQKAPASRSVSASPSSVLASRHARSPLGSVTQDISKKPHHVCRKASASPSVSALNASVPVGRDSQSPSGSFSQDVFKEPISTVWQSATSPPPIVQTSQSSSESARHDFFASPKHVNPEPMTNASTPESSPTTGLNSTKSASVTPRRDISQGITSTEIKDLNQLARSASNSTNTDAATPPSAQPGTSGHDVLEVLKPGRLLTHSLTPSTSTSTTSSDGDLSAEDSEPEKPEPDSQKPEPTKPKLVQSRSQSTVQRQIPRPPTVQKRPPSSSLSTKAHRSQFQTVRELLLAASHPPAGTQQQKVFDPRTMSLSRLGRPNPLEGDSSDDESSSSSNSES